MRRFSVAFAVLFVVTGSLSAERVEPLFVREAIGLKAASAAPRVADREGVEPMVTLAPAVVAAPEELEAIRQWNAEGRTPAKNGFTRSLGEVVSVRVTRDVFAAKSGRGVTTTSERGSLIWGGSVRVAGAYRTRLHLRNVMVPPGTTFWVYGQGETPVAFGTELIDSGGELYTPSVGGEVVYLEMELPEQSPGASFDLTDVLELAGGSPQSDDVPSCLVDALCVGASTLDVISEFRAAVAHLQYVKGGSGFVCTGGLINDTVSSSVIPYLLTANHCFSSQSSATSLESYFDYKTASCNGSFPSISSSPRVNGSTLLATSSTTDFTLVRLPSIPSGRILLGWDTASVPAGTVLHRVSHPFPDSFSVPAPQRYSSTNVTTTSGVCSGSARPQYLYSTFKSGGVYGGSSGSPVILAGGYIVGQLKGSCGPTDPTAGCLGNNMDVDGAFSQTYASVASFINPSTSSGCTASATTACMLNSRFRVTVRYRGGFDNNNVDTNASVKSVTGFANPNFETAFFFFNSESNIEMMVKILDQGNTNGSGQPTIAVLFGVATPLRIELTIVDTNTGATKTYTSSFNSMTGQTDFTAFVK